MSLSEDDIRKIADELFDEIDHNKNGMLEKSEVESYTKTTMERAGKPFDQAKFEEHFQNLDTDGNGNVSKQELIDSLMKSMKE